MTAEGKSLGSDSPLNSDIDNANGSSEGIAEAFTKDQSKEEVGMPMLQKFCVVFFAWAAILSVKILQNYPSAFYLKFLQDRDLNKTYGSIAISTAMISMLIGPYIVQHIKRWTLQPLWKRSMFALFGNILSNSALGLIDSISNSDESGIATYFTIGFVRTIQGLSLGVLFVIAFGEVVDKFFKIRTKSSVVSVVLSSAIQISLIVGSLTSAWTYTVGGWLITGPGIALFSVIALVFVPIIRHYEMLIELQHPITNVEYKDLDSQMKSDCQKPKLSIVQYIAFYLPDAVIAINCLTYNMVAYVLPLRAFNFNSISLEESSLVLSIIYVVGFVCSFGMAFLTSRRVDIFFLMLSVNTCYYAGFFISYGFTADLIDFPYAFHVGCFLIGIGCVGHMNLCIVSQFTLYKIWGIEDDALGKGCATMFNAVVAVASVVGIVVSGLPATRSSEVPTFIYLGTAYLVSSACFVFCKVQSSCFSRSVDPGKYSAIQNTLMNS